MSRFDEKIDRFHTASVKWERTKEVFGEEGLWPMWVADMDFRPPEAVLDKIKSRADHGVFGYTFVPPSTAQAIAGWLEKRHQWNIKPSWLLYCAGVVQAIGVAINAFTEPGDKILLQSPVYTPFFDMINRNHRTVANVPLTLENGRYGMDFASLENALKEGCKALMLCNPHNPGGRVWTKEELMKIGGLCQKYNCLIFSDEIHSDLVYKNYKHYPIASLSEDFSDITITFIAPSKTFNLAGLQASAIIIKNEKLRNQYNEALRQLGFFSLNTFGITAMEASYQEGGPWLEELIDYLQDNKDYAISFIQEQLPDISPINPEGTYLLWLDCRKLNLTDEELKKALIEKGKLALEPGPKYGTGGEGFVRMNLACPKEDLVEGLKRLKRAFA